MTPHDELDRELLSWLDDIGSRSTPRNLEMVLERTRHMRQRPAWASFERWLPMTVITARPAMAMPLRMAWLLFDHPAGAGNHGRQLHSRLAPAQRDRPDPPGRRGRPCIQLGGWRPVHHPRRRHRPAPAHDWSRAGFGPRLVARWHAHRLPKDRLERHLGRGHGRARRSADDRLHLPDACERRVRPARTSLVTRWRLARLSR